MNIVLCLLGDKGFGILKAITPYRTLHNISVAIGQDKAMLYDGSSNMIEWCQQQGISYELSNKPNLTSLQPELVVAAGWRWLLPTGNWPVLVFHDSLLPRYRGFNPLVSALINGDAEVGVTALWAVEDYDAGPILAQEKINITYPKSIAEAITEVAALYQSIFEKVMTQLNQNILPSGIAQDESKATYSIWRDEADYAIDWHESADRICRSIYALGYPYQGAQTELDGKTIVIQKAESLNDLMFENRKAGKLFSVNDQEAVVICGKGLLKIKKAQWKHNGEPVQFIKLRQRLS